MMKRRPPSVIVPKKIQKDGHNISISEFQGNDTTLSNEKINTPLIQKSAMGTTHNDLFKSRNLSIKSTGSAKQ